MIKATVLVPLNIRTGKPEILPNNNIGDKFYNEGDVIEVAEGAMGENYKGNNLWYKLVDGGFVWSGGVETSGSPEHINQLAGSPFSAIINYSKDAFNSIPLNVKSTKGIGVKIAVIDTGINKDHPSFNNDPIIQLISNVTSSPAGVDDKNGHGSHVAGLIGGRSVIQTGIIGIAPKSELLIIKGIDDDRSTSATNINLALKLAIDAKADIINLSLDIANSRFNLIESEINRAIGEEIIIVAAAGENNRLIENGNLFCPANKAGIIAVGSCDDSFIRSQQKFNPKVNWIIPNYSFWSSYNKTKTYETERGSSMATALVSGLVSLIISFNKTKKLNQIINLLNISSLPLSQFSTNETSLLNPLK
ncbi:MAG: S8 family serine peptidase [Ferruginibacter sp.]